MGNWRQRSGRARANSGGQGSSKNCTCSLQAVSAYPHLFPPLLPALVWGTANKWPDVNQRWGRAGKVYWREFGVTSHVLCIWSQTPVSLRNSAEEWMHSSFALGSLAEANACPLRSLLFKFQLYSSYWNCKEASSWVSKHKAAGMSYWTTGQWEQACWGLRSSATSERGLQTT